MLIAADHIWYEHGLQSDFALWITDGRVTDIGPLGTATPDMRAALLLPLLTDLQVNGGGGTMLNNDPTPDGVLRIAAAHRSCGTGTILPTVITDTHDVIEAAADAVRQTYGARGIGGIHIEGPHISPERPGTHDPCQIRPLDQRSVDLVRALRQDGIPVMITLAPERTDPEMLRALADSGAVVSGGHSAATATQTYEALTQGLGCFTHLYNAMPAMTSREPGILGAALNSDAYAGIIVDGIHVSWDMVRVALRARPRAGLTFAVSDAMATVGGPDHFELYGQTIHVENGALVNAEGSLAGAHIDLVQSLANLVLHVGLPLAEAIPMVSDIPRAVVSLPSQALHVGMDANDILMLNDDFTMVRMP
ncbi:N-acetylglucosamine-6-phosphate deacetylase [Candidatus Rhodobacter oscarellae]|uniref:N-acetylglucosamine-6-phosphate deacetylase n=1 Tax=Candidatus Rhodobacter oscarellae TaxID=1675527 RepID=A0A0J9ED35_9RHOB|nr:N-acetylglucosamine-6-phosphate deacetylase [Candidatus Rhodobacter lobularis]KMW60712.1 N-acetylglucosamine-6-phosphate deacetylase [Candidatus Rhodobacter lobularis]